MPTYKGIQFEVLSQYELGTHPEFPHPESSQFTWCSTPKRSPDRQSSVIDWEPPSVSAVRQVSKADALLGRNTTCAVYIPTVAGAQFWLRYDIDESAVALSKLYYFKLFMNGRNMVSWGVNATKKPSGQIMQGLFDPSPQWNYLHNGLERRAFYFSNADQRSATNDGGLIEILCFRAEARKRKLPEPTIWKDQQAYGIVTPSEGLHENPEEAKFFDWHLTDPTDAPFIVFKFHYRSWDSLQLLELIPEDHPRTMLRAPRDLLPEELEAILEVKSNDLPFLDSPHPPCRECKPSIPVSMSTNSLSNMLDSTVFDDSSETASEEQQNEEMFHTSTQVSPLKIRGRNQDVPTSKFSSAVVDKLTPSGKSLPQTSTKTGSSDGFINRPLRQIPVRRSSRKLHSRNSSTVSRAPSVTPSLLPYLDRDSMSPEPEIGVATIVELSYNSPAKSPSLKSDSDMMDTGDVLANPAEVSLLMRHPNRSIEEGSSSMLQREPPLSEPNFSQVRTAVKRKPVPTPSAASKRQGMTRPPASNILSSSSMSNIIFRKHRRSTVQKLPVSISAATVLYREEEDDFLTEDEMNTLSLSDTMSLEERMPLSESEWMYRAPSAVRPNSQQGRHPQSTRPTPVARKIRKFDKGSSSLGNKLRRKSVSWYRRGRTGSADAKENISHDDNEDMAARTPVGNWI